MKRELEISGDSFLNNVSFDLDLLTALENNVSNKDNNILTSSNTIFSNPNTNLTSSNITKLNNVTNNTNNNNKRIKVENKNIKWIQLPQQIISFIFSYLNYMDYNSLSQINNSKIGSSLNSVWKDMFTNTFLELKRNKQQSIIHSLKGISIDNTFLLAKKSESLEFNFLIDTNINNNNNNNLFLGNNEIQGGSNIYKFDDIASLFLSFNQEESNNFVNNNTNTVNNTNNYTNKNNNNNNTNNKIDKIQYLYQYFDMLISALNYSLNLLNNEFTSLSKNQVLLFGNNINMNKIKAEDLKNRLQYNYEAISKFIKLCKKTISRIYERMMVPSSQILFILRNTTERFDIATESLRILEIELKAILSGDFSKNFPVSIVILQQPPSGIYRSKTSWCFKAQVLSSPTLFNKFNTVNMIATVPKEKNPFGDSKAGKKQLEEFLEKNVSDIKVNGFDFLFPEITFSKPTRKNPVSLVFSSKIQYNKSEIEVTSKPTENYIIFCHQNQWIDTFKNFVENSFFKAVSNPSDSRKIKIPWCLFVNTFNKHFISSVLMNPSIAPKQDQKKKTTTTSKKKKGNNANQKKVEMANNLMESQHQMANTFFRIFSANDWTFIHKKFFERKLEIFNTQVNEYLDWVGHFLYALKYYKEYGNIWQNGLIEGFMNKDEINILAYGPGAFIMRFSTANPGDIVISFVSKSGKSIEHYMVKESDLTTKTREDLFRFLMSVDKLKYILHLKGFSLDCADPPQPLSSPENGEYNKFDKQEILSKFIKIKKESQLEGYDQYLC